MTDGSILRIYFGFGIDSQVSITWTKLFQVFSLRWKVWESSRFILNENRNKQETSRRLYLKVRQGDVDTDWNLIFEVMVVKMVYEFSKLWCL